MTILASFNNSKNFQTKKILVFMNQALLLKCQQVEVKMKIDHFNSIEIV
jgi:hypothetical protein